MYLTDSVTGDIERAQQLLCRDYFGKCKGLSYCVPNNRDVVGGTAFVIMSFVEKRIADFFLSFDTDRFFSLAFALETRWVAAGSLENKQVKNSIGASCNNVVLKWVSANGSVQRFRQPRRVVCGPRHKGSVWPQAAVGHKEVQMRTPVDPRRMCLQAAVVEAMFPTSNLPTLKSIHGSPPPRGITED